MPVEKPVPVAVEIRDRPPADLLICPATPDGFPTDTTADLPASIRAAAIRLARAYRANADQLRRIIRWHDQKACQ